MLFDIKKFFYWNEIIKILKVVKCPLKKKKNFRNFMKRFQSDLIIENNDLLKSMFIQNVSKASMQSLQFALSRNLLTSSHQNIKIFITSNSIREHFNIKCQSLYHDNLFAFIKRTFRFSISVFDDRIQREIKFILVEYCESKTKH